MGADIARLLAVSAQQVSRWKSDGVLSFGADGMVDALDAVRAIFDWAGHGREPKAARHLRDRARGADYWRGLADGLEMMGRVTSYYREARQTKSVLTDLGELYRQPPLSDAELSRLLALPPLDAGFMANELADAQRVMDAIGLDTATPPRPGP